MRVEHLTDAEIALRPHRISGPAANALLDRGAIMPTRAIIYAAASAEAHRDLVSLRASGAVKSTIDGRVWFDLRNYYAAKAQRERMRAMIAVPVAIVFAAVATLFYRG